MRIMLDFACKSCGAVKEKLINHKEKVIECECGGKAMRIISTPTIRLDGTSGHFPSAHDKWATIREKHARRKAAKRQRTGADE